MIKSVAKDIAEIQYLPTFRFMGYDSEGLAKVIYWYENKEKKMTREEAVDKFHAIVYPDSFKLGANGNIQWERDRKWAIKAIDAYEALGLIKFDEPEKLSPTEIFKKIYNEYKSGLTAEAFIKRLNYEGVYIEDLNPK